jgi:hypothetical protein
MSFNIALPESPGAICTSPQSANALSRIERVSRSRVVSWWASAWATYAAAAGDRVAPSSARAADPPQPARADRQQADDGARRDQAAGEVAKLPVAGVRDPVG